MNQMKKKKLLIWATLICLIFTACNQPDDGFPKPVNKNASKEAKQLLQFLYSINGQYTLTGQHNFVSDFDRYDDLVYSITEKRPVVWGADFSFMAEGDNVRRFQHCGPMNLTVPRDSCYVTDKTKEELRQSLVDEAIAKHAEGRVITLMWHCCFPTNGDECNGDDIWRWADNMPTEEEWAELTTDGTPLNTLWKKQLDGVAIYLKKLQEAKVPVLWRPYHEMNGVWFWWCNKPGENGFQKLYINMYNYFTNYHKLNNLLWVWNTNAPRDIPGDEAGPYEDYFPGIDYVDVLTADVYRQDYKQSHHDDILKVGENKLIALGEVGDLPTIEQYEAQPNWSWFMVWGYFIDGNRRRDLVRSIYAHPQSITLDEIDFSGKTYKLRKDL
jgi:mannan endo-1,4-beta-mannosidase